MEKIHVIARFKIHDGQLDAFKAGADQCVATTSTEPGAMLYDWFIDEENMACTVVETYEDSEATLAHAANINEDLGNMMQFGDFSGEVFGNASQELIDALAPMNIKPVPFYRGL